MHYIHCLAMRQNGMLKEDKKKNIKVSASLYTLTLPVLHFGQKNAQCAFTRTDVSEALCHLWLSLHFPFNHM